MSTANIVPHVNAFIQAMRAVPLRFKVENLPVAAKSFVTIPAGSGAVNLEIVKSAALCVHVYGSLEVVRRDLKVDFQIKNRVYTSPLLAKPENIATFLTTLGTLLPEAVRNEFSTELLVNEIESAILPLLRK